MIGDETSLASIIYARAAAWNWPLIGSFIVGAAGVGLGLWNRVDQIKDRRKAAHAALPKAELMQVGSYANEWCEFRVVISSQTPARLEIVSVEGRGWTFTVGKRVDITRPEWDPGETIADIEKQSNSLALSIPVDIDARGLVYTDANFWATCDALKNQTPTPTMILNCRWRWGEQKQFKLKTRF